MPHVYLRMMRSRLLFAFCLVAGAARAQQVSTAVVPVVGSVFGAAMVRWKTDVEIENASPFPAEVVIELPSVPEAFYGVTLGPGERQRFPDIVGQLFGLDNALSALRVTSDRRVVVHANAYAASGTAASPMQPIDVYYGPAFAPFRMLDNLAFSDGNRTNIGLVNFGERDAQFTLALRRIPGRDLAVTFVTVHAGSMIHMSIQSLFPMITEGSGFSILVETSARDTYVYGSVIDSETNAARFVSPRVGTQ
jgi:hypothetical protein